MSPSEMAALVTGATGPVGQQLVSAFASAEARLAVAVRRIDAVRTTEQLYLQQGIHAFISPCDVRFEEDVIRLVHRVIRQFGRIDVLVNAAAIEGPKERIIDHAVEPWRKVIATNVTGTYLLCREVLPWMIRQRHGCIFNLHGGTPKNPKAESGASAISGFAVEALTRQLASELVSTGVSVHAVEMPRQTGEKPTDLLRKWADEIVRRAHRHFTSEALAGADPDSAPPDSRRM